MAKAAAGDVTISHFDDQLRSYRLPSSRPLSVPAARPSWSVAIKAGAADKRFELAVSFGRSAAEMGRGGSDMVELALGIVEAEEQRADRARILSVAKSAHHAIGGAQPLDLEHRTLTRLRRSEFHGWRRR